MSTQELIKELLGRGYDFKRLNGLSHEELYDLYVQDLNQPDDVDGLYE